MTRTWTAMASITLLALAGLANWPRTLPALGQLEGCMAYEGLPPGWGERDHAGMVFVEGGRFTPGVEGGYLDERPLAPIEIDGFWIDRTEVTRAQFSDFVASTGYVTDAERVGGAAVFRVPDLEDTSPMPWWKFVLGANWRYPDGPGQPAASLDNHPVTQVTLADAEAYARWRGNELPDEAHWEFAARGGHSSQRLGEEPRDSHGRPSANYWQGVFPLVNDVEDGFAGLAPVGCFVPNGYGLYDMIGNVWEWTTDTQRNPLLGHLNGDPSTLRSTPPSSEPRIIKGGSYLCATSYCARFRSAARERQASDLATSHVGFRTIKRISRY
ncbi:formylglycine-generating enzyme family protein [Pseudomonas sp. CM25]|nr:formylglycine-generating enzyme family protein [Pseudomonas sp. CM25]